MVKVVQHRNFVSSPSSNWAALWPSIVSTVTLIDETFAEWLKGLRKGGFAKRSVLICLYKDRLYGGAVSESIDEWSVFLKLTRVKMSSSTVTLYVRSGQELLLLISF